MKIDQEIKDLIEQLDVLKSKKKEQMSHYKTKPRISFKCGCGKRHMLKQCIAIQTHWYTPPHGCTGGDYWNSGELHIICPDTDHKNRVMLDNYDVPWEERQEYNNDPEEQFKVIYRNYFVAVIQDYGKDNRRSYNNYYFDKNRKRFGLVEKRKNENV